MHCIVVWCVSVQATLRCRQQSQVLKDTACRRHRQTASAHFIIRHLVNAVFVFRYALTIDALSCLVVQLVQRNEVYPFFWRLECVFGQWRDAFVTRISPRLVRKRFGYCHRVYKYCIFRFGLRCCVLSSPRRLTIAGSASCWGSSFGCYGRAAGTFSHIVKCTAVDNRRFIAIRYNIAKCIVGRFANGCAST